VEDLRTYLRDAPPVLGESVKIRPIDARGRDRLGMRPEEWAKRQSEMMKARWARNRGGPTADKFSLPSRARA